MLLCTVEQPEKEENSCYYYYLFYLVKLYDKRNFKTQDILTNWITEERYSLLSKSTSYTSLINELNCKRQNKGNQDFGEVQKMSKLKKNKKS